MKRIKQRISEMFCRGVVHKETYEYDKLFEFVRDVYMNLSQGDKKIASYYLKLGKPLDKFDIEYAKNIHHTQWSDKITNSINNKKNNMGDLAWKEMYKNNASKSKQTRIIKNGSIKLSYINGLLTKGKKIANELNITEVLTDTEYISLTGKAKKDNFSKLSDEEKNIKKIRWKLSNLSNKNVLDMIKKEYPDFTFNDNFTEEEIEKWFFIYNSIKVSDRIKNNPESCNSYGISGWHYSNKMNEKFYYRSTLEKKHFILLDESILVESYEPEPRMYKYMDNEGKCRRYLLDCEVVLTNGIILYIEVKPKFKVELEIDNKLSKVGLNLTIVTENELKTKENFNEFISKYF